MNEDAETSWTDAVLQPLVRHLQDAYPKEGCGLVVVDEDGHRRFQACDNVIDKYHRLDPETYPRTSREFYMIDPREFLAVEKQGAQLEVIVHSHPDTGDYFSDDDVEAALMPRESSSDPVEPLVPGADYLVVSVCGGEAVSASLYRFQATTGSFERVEQIDGEKLHSTISNREVEGSPSV